MAKVLVKSQLRGKLVRTLQFFCISHGICRSTDNMYSFMLFNVVLDFELNTELGICLYFFLCNKLHSYVIIILIF